MSKKSGTAERERVKKRGYDVYNVLLSFYGDLRAIAATASKATASEGGRIGLGLQRIHTYGILYTREREKGGRSGGEEESSRKCVAFYMYMWYTHSHTWTLHLHRLVLGV